uniref:PD-(D/E)XK motif protein n=1 Tax=unclassified Oceanobacillus TaxID=2630292 RepID=UPI00403F4749
MLVLNYLQKSNIVSNLKWVGYKGSTYDISTQNKEIEVKASLNKFDNSITISNQYQLYAGLTHEIYVLRFETSHNEIGIAIDDIVKELKMNGYPEKEIENRLDTINLSKNSAIRRQKFILLNCKKYDLKDVTPLTVEKAMNNFLELDLVKKITVEIDLANIKNEEIELC